MLSILGRNVRLGDGINRRELLRIGGLGFTGLLRPGLLRATTNPQRTGKAKACILV